MFSKTFVCLLDATVNSRYSILLKYVKCVPEIGVKIRTHNVSQWVYGVSVPCSPLPKMLYKGTKNTARSQ